MDFTEGQTFEDAYDIVIKKVHEEMNEYLSSLKQETKEEIIRSAYQTVCKDEIILVLENNIHWDDEYVVLSKMKHPLEWIYQQWLKSSLYFSDAIEECIEYNIERINDCGCKHDY